MLTGGAGVIEYHGVIINKGENTTIGKAATVEFFDINHEQCRAQNTASRHAVDHRQFVTSPVPCSPLFNESPMSTNFSSFSSFAFDYLSKSI